MATTTNNGITGISATGAKNIKTAVNEYRTMLKQKSDFWLATTSLGSTAIRGDVSLKDFNQMVNLFMQDNAKYINYLQQFENKIDEILNRYKASDEANNTFSSDARQNLR